MADNVYELDPSILAEFKQKSPNPILVINKDLVIVFMNVAASLCLNKPLDLMMGKKLSNVLFENSRMREMHDGYMGKVMLEGITTETQSMGDRTIHYGDKYLKINLRLNDTREYCAAYLLDVTSEVELKKELSDAKVALSQKQSLAEKVAISTVDTRQKIINYLFVSIGTLAILLLLIARFTPRDGDKSALKTIEVLLAGLSGSLTSTLGFYFQSNASQQARLIEKDDKS